MAGRMLGNNAPMVVLQTGEADGGGDDADSALQRRDGELRRMAAFRVRETANRIATLANSAGDERLRQELLSIGQTLLREERALLDKIDAAPALRR